MVIKKIPSKNKFQNVLLLIYMQNRGIFNKNLYKLELKQNLFKYVAIT